MRLYEHRYPFPEYSPIRNYKPMKVLKKEMEEYEEQSYYNGKEYRSPIIMPLIVVSCVVLVFLFMYGLIDYYLISKR